MDEALTELILKAGTQLALSAIRAHLSRDPGLVDSAIEKTDRQFPGAEPALGRWVSTESFDRLLARVAAGDHEVIDDAAIRSFVEEGDYYMPNAADAMEAAKPIVTALLGAVLTGLLEGDQGTPVLANRMEWQHEETMAELRELRVSVDQLAAQPANTQSATSMSLAKTTEDGETAPDPSDAALTARIDAASDLFNAGKVVSARALLEHIRASTDEIPDALGFRLLTNLGACAVAAGDIEQGAAFIEAAYELQPTNPTALANSATAAGLRGEYPRAAELARQSLELQPRDGHAASVLMGSLKEAGETEELELLIAEDWITDDPQAALTLARIWIDQRKFDEARELSERFVERDPDDHDAHLALAECLLAATHAGHEGDAIATCEEIESHATQALEILEDKELAALRLQAWSIRAGARLLLDDIEAATSDIDAMLTQDPGNAGALYNKGLIFLETGRHSDARASLTQIDDPTMRDRALLPLAEACRHDGDPAEAAALLRGSFSLDSPEWEDIRRAEMLCEVEAALGDDDSVETLLARAQELEPDSARLFLVEAAHHRAHERIADAEAALVRALDCASAEDGPILRWRLAAFYGQCERYSEAADLFEEVVGGDVSHSGAIPLLVSLRNGERLRAALDWARAIRAQHPNPYKVALETEAHILNQVGDVEAAAARWGDICIRDDATETDHLRHAQALLWAGERDEAAEKVREIDASALADEPKQLLALAQIKCLLGEQEYLRDAYAARRGGVDDPSIHMGYFALFMTLDARMSAPEVVEPGCAVLLRNEFGDQWWLVVEHGEDTPGDHELHPDTDLAKSLLGRGRGETVVHQEGMGAKSSEVVEIQNRYVRAFQETTAEFPTRFPGNADLTSIPVKADDFAEFLGIVDEADRLARDLMQLYRDDHVPFASLCQRLARPAPDIWRACTTSDDVRLRFGSGTVQEAEEAAEALRSCDTITLDMLSLLTAHALGIEEHLRRRFGRV